VRNGPYEALLDKLSRHERTILCSARGELASHVLCHLKLHLNMADKPRVANCTRYRDKDVAFVVLGLAPNVAHVAVGMIVNVADKLHAT